MQTKKLLLLFCSLLLLLSSCSPAAPAGTAAPENGSRIQESTPSDSVTRERAVRLVRSAVLAEIQIVDPFSVEIKEMQGSGEVLAVSYLSPLNIDDPKFEEELARVVFKALPQFLRAEPALPRLVVIATSVGDLPGSKGFAIDYKDAMKWVNGKIDDQSFKDSWVAAE